MAPQPSFELAARLKASQQILAKELWVNSWMVWCWLLGHAATWICVGFGMYIMPDGVVNFFPGHLRHVEHLHAGATKGVSIFQCTTAFVCDFPDRPIFPNISKPQGFYAVIVVFISFVAFCRSRAGGVDGAWPAPLYVIFPQNYSAFGLAKGQRPARVFMVILALLGLPGVGMIFQAFIITDPSFVGWTAEGALFFRIGMWGAALFSCGWYMLSGCFFCAPRFSGAALADRSLQERIASKSEILSGKMASKQEKPNWMEYGMLHLEMLLFAADFVSDGLAGWQFLQGEMYVLFALQLGIVLVSLWAETRQMRRHGNLMTWCRAFTESSRYGWPTDEFLAIMLMEKSVEAPLTFLLQGYAVWAVSLQAMATEGRSVAFFHGKLALAAFGVAKGAYVLIHLDLARHLHAVQEDAAAILGAAAPTAPSNLVSPPAVELPPAMADAQPAAPQSGAQDAGAFPPGLSPPPPRASMPPLPPLPGLEGVIQVGKPRGFVDRE